MPKYIRRDERIYFTFLFYILGNSKQFTTNLAVQFVIIILKNSLTGLKHT